MWSWSPEGARLIPEGALEGCLVEVLIPALYGVLMREVGARALWWCQREAGDRGCGRGLLGGRHVSGESGVLADRRQGVLDCLMDRNFGLLIDSGCLGDMLCTGRGGKGFWSWSAVSLGRVW